MYTAITQKLKEIYIQEIYRLIESQLKQNREHLTQAEHDRFDLLVSSKNEFQILRDLSETEISPKFYEQKDVLEKIEDELGIEIKLKLWRSPSCFGSIKIITKENGLIQNYVDAYNLSIDFEKQQLEHLAMATVFALRKAIIDGDLTIKSSDTLHIDTVECLSEHSYYMSCIKKGMSSVGYSSVKYDSLPSDHHQKKVWIITY